MWLQNRHFKHQNAVTSIELTASGETAGYLIVATTIISKPDFFFVFSNKMALKGQRFTCVMYNQGALTRELQIAPVEF